AGRLNLVRRPPLSRRSSSTPFCRPPELSTLTKQQGGDLPLEVRQVEGLGQEARPLLPFFYARPACGSEVQRLHLRPRRLQVPGAPRSAGRTHVYHQHVDVPFVPIG